MALFAVVRIRHQVSSLAIHGHPLLGSCWALAQLPLEPKEVLKVIVGPFCGRVCPNAFQSTGNGVWTRSGSKAVFPTGSLLGNGRSSWLGTDVLTRVSRTVRLSKRVSACNQRHSLLVVHGHAAERLADIVGRSEWVGIAIGAFWVHINQSHLDSTQRILQFTFSFVTLVVQPFSLRPPVNVLFWFPHIGAATGKAKRFETHAFEGHIASQNHQVRPRDLAAILLLDGPQQTTSLVQVGVVWPAVERSKAKHSCPCTTATVTDPVGACTVPCHANEEWTIVPPVCGPPLLRVGHQLRQVLANSGQVERLEFCSVIEILSHGIRQAGVHAKNAEVELIGPPIGVPCAATGTVIELPVQKRTLCGVSVWIKVHVGRMS